MKAILWVDDFYLNNRIFDLNDPISNRDDCMYGFHCLREEFKKHDINLVTQDKCYDDPAFIIGNDVIVKSKFPSYLLRMESELIKPLTWHVDNISRKIFTWSPIKDTKNIQYFWPQRFREMKYVKKEKRICIFGNDKQNNDPRELYSWRVHAINNIPDIDVYGTLPKSLGRPPSKDIMSRYKLAICFENACDIPGYVTEKIWDCFFNGVVPIYWGAPDITDYVPENCFIDFRKFNHFNDLQEYIDSIDTTVYLNNINAFLQTDKAKRFSGENFAKILVEAIVK